MPKSVATPDRIADYMLTDYWNSETTTFVDMGGITGDGVIRVDLRELDAAGKRIARWAMESWESVADVHFREVRSGAEVTFDDSGSAPVTWFTLSGTSAVSIDLNVPKSYIEKHGGALDQYAFQLYLHEIGHVLGLGHPGPYNHGRASFADTVFANDSWQMSVMSYFAQNENRNVPHDRAAILGPMEADILAAQKLFGAPKDDPTVGDTIWGAGSNLSGLLGDYFRAMEAGSGTIFSDSAFSFLLRDSGGTDTIDFSFEDYPQIAKLNSFVEITNPGTGEEHAYILIADGTTIENYASGGGTDRVIGTGKDNVLTLGQGDDFARGKGGDDWIEGDLGHDRLYGNRGRDKLFGGDGEDLLKGGGDKDKIKAGNGMDRLFGGSANDRLWGEAHGDELFGQAGRDKLFGGDGVDILNGGAGNDRLDGGTAPDTMTGGGGADVFIFRKGTGTDRILDFETGRDVLRLDGDMLGGQSVEEVLERPLELDGELMLRFESGDRVVLEGLSPADLDDIDVLLF